MWYTRQSEPLGMYFIDNGGWINETFVVVLGLQTLLCYGNHLPSVPYRFYLTVICHHSNKENLTQASINPNNPKSRQLSVCNNEACLFVPTYYSSERHCQQPFDYSGLLCSQNTSYLLCILFIYSIGSHVVMYINAVNQFTSIVL